MSDPRMNSPYPQIDNTPLTKNDNRERGTSYTNGGVSNFKVPEYYDKNNIITYYLMNRDRDVYRKYQKYNPAHRKKMYEITK